MPTPPARTDRRTGALSAARIVSAAVAILDGEGENALTFRALAERLATGPGAIYWHVDNKDVLLAQAADEVLARAMNDVSIDDDPAATVRAAALAVFDVISAHPWVGAQLSREPWGTALLRILDKFGQQLPALGVAAPKQFDTATALTSYVLGLAGQYAAAARLVPRDMTRSAFLELHAERWRELDPADFAFVRRMAPGLRDHDDRAQFLAGVDLILAGVSTLG